MPNHFGRPFDQDSQTKNETPPAAVLLWLLVFGAALTTIGWNFGVSEVIQACGGPDGNLSILEGGALFLALLVAKQVTNSA